MSPVHTGGAPSSVEALTGHADPTGPVKKNLRLFTAVSLFFFFGTVSLFLRLFTAVSLFLRLFTAVSLILRRRKIRTLLQGVSLKKLT